MDNLGSKTSLDNLDKGKKQINWLFGQTLIDTDYPKLYETKILFLLWRVNNLQSTTIRLLKRNVDGLYKALFTILCSI